MALSDIDKSPLYIDSTNSRVGIGTNSPNEALTIEAPLSGDTGLAINYNGDNKAGITVNPTTGQIQVGAHPDLTSANAYYLSFNTASSNTVYERLRIDSTGVVGIGTNSPSGAKLEIFTGSTAVDGLKISRYTPGNYYSTLRQDNHGLAIHVGTGGTVSERVAITPNGITFNGDTAAANALDDYEEGTWTPAVSSASSHAVQTGIYTKIGNLVTIQCVIQFVQSGTVFGSVSGLPFTVAEVNYSGITFREWYSTGITLSGNLTIGAQSTTGFWNYANSSTATNGQTYGYGFSISYRT